MIRPGALFGHWPLWGDSPESDLTASLNHLTLTNAPLIDNHGPSGRYVKMPAAKQMNVSGSISGQVTVSGQPRRRLIRIYDRATGVLVDFTYSNDVDGIYEQRELDRSKKYFVVELDE